MALPPIEHTFLAGAIIYGTSAQVPDLVLAKNMQEDFFVFALTQGKNRSDFAILCGLSALWEAIFRLPETLRPFAGPAGRGVGTD